MIVEVIRAFAVRVLVLRVAVVVVVLAGAAVVVAAVCVCLSGVGKHHGETGQRQQRHKDKGSDNFSHKTPPSKASIARRREEVKTTENKQRR